MRGIKDRRNQARKKKRKVKSRVLENYPPPSSKKILHYLTTNREAKRTEIRDDTRLSYSRVHENLTQMEKDGLVESESDKTSKRGDPIKEYSLTFAGLRATLQDYQEQAFEIKDQAEEKLEDLAIPPRSPRPVNPEEKKQNKDATKQEIPRWLIEKMQEELDEEISEEEISIKMLDSAPGPAPSYIYEIFYGEKSLLVLNRKGTLEFYYKSIWQKFGLKNPWGNVETIMKEYPSFFPGPIRENWQYLKEKNVVKCLIEKYMKTEISMPSGVFGSFYDSFRGESTAQPRNLTEAWFRFNKKLQLSGLARSFMAYEDNENLKGRAKQYPDYRLMLAIKDNEELRKWILGKLENAKEWHSNLLKDIDSGIKLLERG